MYLTAKTIMLRPLALTLALLSAPPLFAREDAFTPKAAPPGTPTEPKRDDRKPQKTEGVAKPPSGTRPNPEQANPALLNPCHGSPQPKWCGE